MESGVVALDILQIRKQKDANRTLLTHDPDNLMARIRLAWCLFAEALYESGRKVQGSDGGSEGGQPAPGSGPDTESALKQSHMSVGSGASLADEALRHAVTAKLLSVRPEDRMEAERLEELIVSMADSDAADRIRSRVYQAMSELSADVLDNAVVASPRARRRAAPRPQ